MGLPDMQGKGVGRLLFEEVTDKADGEGRRCYLESSGDVPNSRIYERLGFRMVKGIQGDNGGSVCKLYCLIRDLQGLPGNASNS